MSDAVNKIRLFLKNDIGIDTESLSDTDTLFTSGLVDSFSLIELLMFLENDLNTKVDIAELGLDDLDTITALSKLAG